MDHVAIMNKQLGLINRILSGHKTIETRWYKNRLTPYDKIKIGDTIYFKDSGGLVRASATVSQIKQFPHLTLSLTKEIVDTYGDQIDIKEKTDLSWAENKNYALLIWLKNVKSLEPFEINKAGFGSGCAWLTIDNVNNLKIC